MKHPPPEDCKNGKHALEHLALAPREDGDIAGGGTVAAPGHRTIDGCRAGGGHFRAKPCHLSLVGGAHLGPDLAVAKTGEDSILGFHHGGARRR